MKKLNQHSTKVFLKLLEKLGPNTRVQVYVANRLPLTFERIQTVSTPEGHGTLFSLTYQYRQGKKEMREPQMCFILVDNRRMVHEPLAVSVYPQSYLQDSLDVLEESIRIERGKVVNVIDTWQLEHCRAGNILLKTIQEEGFV